MRRRREPRTASRTFRTLACGREAWRPAWRTRAPPPTEPPVAGFRDVGQNLKVGLPLIPLGAELLKNGWPTRQGQSRGPLPADGDHSAAHPGRPSQVHPDPDVPSSCTRPAREREIFTDGRELPSSDDLQPWWNGYSTARWDGDTLVVETSGFRDGGWLDIFGTPLSDRHVHGTLPPRRTMGAWRSTLRSTIRGLHGALYRAGQ